MSDQLLTQNTMIFWRNGYFNNGYFNNVYAKNLVVNPIAFGAVVGSAQPAATGDGTIYKPIFDAIIFQYGSNYNPTTGSFMAPQTGAYLFTVTMTVTGCNNTNTSALLNLLVGSGTFPIYNSYIPNIVTSSNGGLLIITGSAIVSLLMGESVSVQLTISGATKNVTVQGVVNSSYFSGSLLD